MVKFNLSERNLEKYVYGHVCHIYWDLGSKRKKKFSIGNRVLAKKASRQFFVRLWKQRRSKSVSERMTLLYFFWHLPSFQKIQCPNVSFFSFLHLFLVFSFPFSPFLLFPGYLITVVVIFFVYRFI